MRLRRACVLLEVIDDDTGQLRAIGYDVVGPNAMGDVTFEHKIAGWDPATGTVRGGLSSRYDIRVRGQGREFHVDLGTWFDTPPPRELNPATPEIAP